jgi:hypothetical protein
VRVGLAVVGLAVRVGLAVVGLAVRVGLGEQAGLAVRVGRSERAERAERLGWSRGLGWLSGRGWSGASDWGTALKWPSRADRRRLCADVITPIRRSRAVFDWWLRPRPASGRAVEPGGRSLVDGRSGGLVRPNSRGAKRTYHP